MAEPTLSTKTLGDVTSDTWRIYKGNFRKIVVISAFVQIPTTGFAFVLSYIMSEAGIGLDFFNEPIPPVDLTGSFIAMLVVFNGLLMAFAILEFVILEGAVTHAVCQQYARRSINISLAFRQTFRRFWPMLGALTLAILALIGMAITIIGIPFAIYFGGRWYFTELAAPIEHTNPRDSLRRSSELVKYNGWRVWGIMLLVWIVIILVATIPGNIIAQIPVVGSIIVSIVLAPSLTIAQTVLYTDQRLRADGADRFNEDVLAEELGLAPVEEEEKWSKFDPA